MVVVLVTDKLQQTQVVVVDHLIMVIHKLLQALPKKVQLVVLVVVQAIQIINLLLMKAVLQLIVQVVQIQVQLTHNLEQTVKMDLY